MSTDTQTPDAPENTLTDRLDRIGDRLWRIAKIILIPATIFTLGFSLCYYATERFAHGVFLDPSKQDQVVRAQTQFTWIATNALMTLRRNVKADDASRPPSCQPFNVSGCWPLDIDEMIESELLLPAEYESIWDNPVNAYRHPDGFAIEFRPPDLLTAAVLAQTLGYRVVFDGRDRDAPSITYILPTPDSELIAEEFAYLD